MPQILQQNIPPHFWLMHNHKDKRGHAYGISMLTKHSLFNKSPNINPQTILAKINLGIFRNFEKLFIS